MKCSGCVHYDVCLHWSKYTNIVPGKDVKAFRCKWFSEEKDEDSAKAIKQEKTEE